MAYRQKLRQIFSINEPPKHIASAFALGVFIGMSPLLGIHTVLGIAAASLLRLNRLVTLVGVYVTNPWTIVPIYTFGTWLGAKLLHVKHILPKVDWAHLTFAALLGDFRPLLMPFLVGNTALGLVSAIASYFIILKSVKKEHA
ncbi:MAG: DUF2062 domain-containing protein [Nitrospiraceae bacterium]|nr:DUF2062 domain-containing protein [Nitrospiraceae bacterium]